MSVSEPSPEAHHEAKAYSILTRSSSGTGWCGRSTHRSTRARVRRNSFSNGCTSAPYRMLRRDPNNADTTRVLMCAVHGGGRSPGTPVAAQRAGASTSFATGGLRAPSRRRQTHGHDSAHSEYVIRRGPQHGVGGRERGRGGSAPGGSASTTRTQWPRRVRQHTDHDGRRATPDPPTTPNTTSTKRTNRHDTHRSRRGRPTRRPGAQAIEQQPAIDVVAIRKVTDGRPHQVRHHAPPL